MNIDLTINDQVLRTPVEEGATELDFVAVQPLCSEVDHYDATEKTAQLPGKPSVSGARAGIPPRFGDISYFAPWGNLAIHYENFGRSTGLIKFGQIESGIAALGASGSIESVIGVATRNRGC